jgi:hypothetical protein
MRLIHLLPKGLPSEAQEGKLYLAEMACKGASRRADEQAISCRDFKRSRLKLRSTQLVGTTWQELMTLIVWP